MTLAKYIGLVIVVGILPQSAWAFDDTAEELKNDVLLRAMVDELERGKTGLKLEDMSAPYFLEFAISDTASASVSAKLGAVTSRGDHHYRRLRTDVRVGSYDLDNTNFQGDRGGFFGMDYFGDGMFSVDLPIEDDYEAIKQALWWSADRKYKSVLEQLERKKAFMKSKTIEDKPADFSKEKPTVHFEPRAEVQIDLAALEKLAVSLSSLFREFPDVQSSSVSVSGSGGNRYLVNSENTRIRLGSGSYSVSINATVQADDGMKFSDSITERGEKFADLPTQAELENRTRDMVATLIKIKNAPILESYSGPVLFDSKPAAQLFSQVFAGKLAGGQRPVGGQTPPDDFEKKIGERVLPKTFDVTDDPTRETIDGVKVAAHYEIDDQGVPVQPVKLVEKGKLLAQVMSRTPSKKSAKSTGHGRGEWRPAATTACLVIATKNGKDTKALRKKLSELCEEEDTEFGIRIASLASSSRSFGGMEGFIDFDMLSSFGMDRFGMGGITPLEMYKVYPDGREELVRGAEIAKFDLRTFKRVPATGKDRYVLNFGSGSSAKTVVAPAMLFPELDLAKVDKDFDKPPILASPLAQATGK